MLQKLIEKEESKNLYKVNNYITLCEEINKFPEVAIVKTNLSDEPSERYTKAKKNHLTSNKCKAHIYEANTNNELISLIHRLNLDENITGIIIQAPFGKGITMETQEVFDLVSPEKDIDRLHSKWYYDKNPKNLPLTAYGIYKILYQYPKFNKILFYGNGLTTNKRLFLHMFDKGDYDCRIINSKTPIKSKNELITWSDIIVAATGVPEILECRDKIVISPTIHKSDNGFRSDLKQECKEFNLTHKVIGGIGKLTTSQLLVRAFEDVLNKR